MTETHKGNQRPTRGKGREIAIREDGGEDASEAGGQSAQKREEE